MRICLLASAVVIISLACPAWCGTPAQAAALQPVRNAYEPADIAPAPSTPIVFVDALNQATPWLSEGPLSVDGDGQVIALSSGQSAQRVVYAAGQVHPAGIYSLLFEGRGSFEFRGATIIGGAQGR